MAELEKNEKKQEKPINKKEKFIWLAASVVIAVVGIIIHNKSIVIPTVPMIIYAAMLLFTIIMSAQKASIERFSFAGENGDKKKYTLMSIFYYVVIILAVAYVVLALWISGIFSV